MDLRSPCFVMPIKTKNHCYLYDVNTNSIVKTDSVLWDLARLLGSVTHGEVRDQLIAVHGFEAAESAYNEFRLARERGMLSSGRPTKIDWPMPFEQIREKLQNEMSQLVLELTWQCNLRCEYCIYSEHYRETRGYGNQRMTFETAKRAIDMFLARSSRAKDRCIAFFGGEPLLCFPLLKACVEYADSVVQDSRNLNYRITTNGTLLTPEVVSFLVKNEVRIGISLDGPQTIHDRYRRYPAGQGTFDVIMANIAHLKQRYPEFYQRNVSLQVVTAPPYEYDQCELFFQEHFPDVQSIHISAVAKGTDWTLKFTQDELYPVAYFRLRDTYLQSVASGNLAKLFEVGDCWRLGLMKFRQALFDTGFCRIHKRSVGGHLPDSFHPGGICIPGARRLYVTVDGDLYPCEKCNTNSRTLKLGDVQSGIDEATANFLIAQYSELTESQCMNCWACRLCQVCFVQAEGPEGLDGSRKLEACEAFKSVLEWELREYCTAQELNSGAWDFFDKYVIS